MSKTPKRGKWEEGEESILRERVERVTSIDPFGDPAYLPPADVNENAEELVIRIELPGVRESEVAVFVQGNVIEVIGEKISDVTLPFRA